MNGTAEGDYVLGTGDVEIERLGLQHRVWRPRALDAWRRAGFTVGQTLLDVGCGPGWATLDLAEIVGAGGRVVAVDRSPRFLDALRSAARARRLSQVDVHARDLATDELPDVAADGAWCRWVLSFVTRPRDLLARMAAALKPGGVLVLHEYFDYRAWRMAPHCPELEEFVDAVMASWRAEGGEPDIALDLPRWLPECGLRIAAMNPIVDVVSPDNYVWQWPVAFVRSGLDRLVALGRMSPARADAIAAAIRAAETTPHTRMITPAVLEIIAVRETVQPRRPSPAAPATGHRSLAKSVRLYLHRADLHRDVQCGGYDARIISRLDQPD